jgi:molecular chaperone DnaK
MAKDNRTLGRFHLVGIPPAPRGVPQVEVAFDIDANGILNVSAKDLGTNKEQKITISGSGGLKEDDINRMVHDAESHADEDKERRQKVEAHNRLDQLIYSTDKTFSEHKEKLAAEDRSSLEQALENAKKALESDEREAMEGAISELTEASHKLAEVMYQQAAPAGGAEGAQASEAGREDDEVVEAEVVDGGEKSD